MPQLDPTSFSSQLFWLTISFVVLYVALARLLLPRVQSVLAHRARTIEGDIGQAERMKAEAEQAAVQYEKALAGARSQSMESQLKVQAEAQSRASARQAELDSAIEKKLAESDQAIAAARQAAKAKLAPAAAEIASLIVELLVHQKPDAKLTGEVVNGLAKERNL